MISKIIFFVFIVLITIQLIDAIENNTSYVQTTTIFDVINNILNIFSPYSTIFILMYTLPSIIASVFIMLIFFVGMCMMIKIMIN